MGTTSKEQRLDYSRPIATRAGSKVRIYEIFYGEYINGAWLEPEREVWIPTQWDFWGNYSHKPSALDLVNV